MLFIQSKTLIQSKIVFKEIIDRSTVLYFSSCVYILLNGCPHIFEPFKHKIFVGSVIIGSVGRSVGGRWISGLVGKWSVVSGSVVGG